MRKIIFKTLILLSLFSTFFSCAVKVETNTLSTTQSSDRTPASSSPSMGSSPNVLSVISTNADGGYVATDVITIQITFSEAVVVSTAGGTPSITLETGTVDHSAIYSSGSGSSVLNFTYTLTTGDLNADLDYKSVSSLNLNGGSIKSTSGTESTLTLPTPGTAGSISDNQEVTVCAGSSYDDLGSGTRALPYIICTAAQLANIGANSTSWNSHYKLLHDIDLTAYTQAADGTQWIPIGTSATRFTGTFDGNLKTISNFTYNDNTKDYVGIFGAVSSSRSFIKDLFVTGVNITGRDYVAPIAGSLVYGNLINTHSSGTLVQGRNYAGGLIGRAESGVLISASSSTITTVTATTAYSGGLVGYAWYASKVLNSFSTSHVTGGTSIGSLIGYFREGLVGNSYATGNAQATTLNASALLATSRYQFIYNSFSIGNATGTDNATSMIGLILDQTSGGSSSGVYYNSAATATNNGTGGVYVSGTAAAANTFYSSTNAPLSNWDFTKIWQSTGAAYPTLQSQNILNSSWGNCSSHTLDTPFAGGTGTSLNPYLICTATQLNNIGSSTTYWSNTHFKLMADIDMNGVNYNIIGTSANPFTRGSFDGNGHTISNLTYNNAATDYVGLFGAVAGSQIKNIGLQNVSIVGKTYVGALIGRANSATSVSSSFSTGTVTGTSNVGGLVGRVENFSLMFTSYSTANVTGTTGQIGGLVGYLSAAGIGSTKVVNCFATGNVTANVAAVEVSAIIGRGDATNGYYNSNSTCTNCTSVAAATGIDVGGTQPASYFYDKTKAPLSSWEFLNTWHENAADYPSFQP